MQTLQLRIHDVIRETHDSVVVLFDKPEGLNYEPGQFLTPILHIDGREERRSYSLCTSPTVDAQWGIGVKRVAGGLVSNYICDHWQAGQEVQVLAPLGRFTLPAPAGMLTRRHLVLLAAGSGITPLMSMLKTVLSQEPNARISLLYANTNAESVMFLDTLKAWQERYGERLHITHALSTPSAALGGIGRLSADNFGDWLRELPPPNPQTLYFLCGPNELMQLQVQVLRSLRIPEANIYQESFTPSTKETADKAPTPTPATNSVAGGAPIVTIRYAGAEYQFEVRPDQTILEAAQSRDIDLPYSCQSGMCTACLGRCVQGKVSLDEEDSLTPGELNAGYVLTCVGRPESDDVIIEID
ncbi:ferredoxin--NADP reductase [Eisenibacter elegans]|uniref:ferredoxin--NADP reductase n=1 Tax=Eisenibacter elegans TaxID=997 RepID=UPI00040DF69A|nr:ferredoxin--NADP reductase [Eisenibacter elegans]